MNSPAKFVQLLKDNGQDHEWYPTTSEIINAFWSDVRKFFQTEQYAAYRGSYDQNQARYLKSYRDEKNILSLKSVIDVGAGDGRVLLDRPEFPDMEYRIENCVGVEKSDILMDRLIARGIWPVGRDYMNTTLIGKSFDVAFSNPPYRIFKTWCEKLVGEIVAEVVYLVIPERWKDDAELVAAIGERFTADIVGSFDFEDGDRSARAKVDLIRLTPKKDASDPFAKWVKDNIGGFKAREKFEPEKIETPTGMALRGDVRKSLVESYNDRMATLVGLYRQLSAIDFNLLSALGITHDTVLAKIKSDIETTKYEFWGKAFEYIDVVRKRLTCTTSKKLVEKMTGFRELDFNEDNIRSIVVWVLENVGKYSEEQLFKCYDDMSYFGSVRAYKSNDRWLNDTWRYEGKKVPEKGMLDYRIVTSGSSLSKDNFANRPDVLDYRWAYHDKTDNIINDLCVVANSLGFDNPCNVPMVWFGHSHDVLDKAGEVLLTFRVFRNGNVHIKIRQDLLQAINVEVGKRKGWLKSPADVESEFELSREEAERMFCGGLRSIEISAITTKLLG